jgi:DNA-binding NarL/FixJ family response regulator
MPQYPLPYQILIADCAMSDVKSVLFICNPGFRWFSPDTGSEEKVPDLLLLDINLPRINGIEAAKTIRSTNPNLKIIVVTMHNHSGMVHTAREMHLNGYILKDSTSQTLLTGIETVLDGRVFFDPKLNKKKETVDEFANLWTLTHREKQVVAGLVAGKKAEEIAMQLGLSYETIKTHRKNIYFKLEINSLAELINMFRDSGIE